MLKFLIGILVFSTPAAAFAQTVDVEIRLSEAWSGWNIQSPNPEVIPLSKNYNKDCVKNTAKEDLNHGDCVVQLLPLPPLNEQGNGGYYQLFIEGYGAIKIRPDNAGLLSLYKPSQREQKMVKLRGNRLKLKTRKITIVDEDYEGGWELSHHQAPEGDECKVRSGANSTNTESECKFIIGSSFRLVLTATDSSGNTVTSTEIMDVGLDGLLSPKESNLKFGRKLKIKEDWAN